MNKRFCWLEICHRLRWSAVVAMVAVAAAVPSFAQAPAGASPQEPAVAVAAAAAAPPARSLLQVLRAGGPVMIPIAFCSFLLTVFVFERAISLRRARVIPKPFVKRF